MKVFALYQEPKAHFDLLSFANVTPIFWAFQWHLSLTLIYVSSWFSSMMNKPYDISAETDLLYSLIVKARFENNRYQKPKKQPKASTKNVDYFWCFSFSVSGMCFEYLLATDRNHRAYGFIIQRNQVWSRNGGYQPTWVKGTGFLLVLITGETAEPKLLENYKKIT